MVAVSYKFYKKYLQNFVEIQCIKKACMYFSFDLVGILSILILLVKNRGFCLTDKIRQVRRKLFVDRP